MKKHIKFICVVILTLCLTPFYFLNGNQSSIEIAESLIENAENSQVEHVDSVLSNEKEINELLLSDIVKDMGTRFNAIKKTDLNNAKSFDDFIGNEHARRIVSYTALSVIVLEDSEKTDIIETSYNGILTPAQLELLKSFDYSTNLLIWADYNEKNKETAIIKESSWTPYLTIVPEKQASYSSGKQSIINYLNQHSKKETAGLVNEKFKTGKLYFTVTKEAIISNIEIVSTSGFPSIDQKIKTLVAKLPGTWQPAENVIGNKVDQTLVISFGRMGC